MSVEVRVNLRYGSRHEQHFSSWAAALRYVASKNPKCVVVADEVIYYSQNEEDV